MGRIGISTKSRDCINCKISVKSRLRHDTQYPSNTKTASVVVPKPGLNIVRVANKTTPVRYEPGHKYQIWYFTLITPLVAVAVLYKQHCKMLFSSACTNMGKEAHAARGADRSKSICIHPPAGVFMDFYRFLTNAACVRRP